MLSKVLILLKPKFARSLKPKTPASSKLPGKIATATQQSHQLQEQQKHAEWTPINKQMKARQQKLKQKVKKLVDLNLKEDQIVSKFIAFEPQENTQIDHTKVDLLRQQMMLNQIMQNYNKKDKQIPIGSNYQEKPINQQEKHLKEERVLEKIRKSKGLENDYDELTFDDKIRLRYPSSIILEAEAKKNKQLSYFKQLMSDNYVQQHEQPHNQPLIQRRLNKGESYSDISERDRIERQRIKQIKAQNRESLQLYKQFQTAQKQSRKRSTQQIVEFEDENFYKQKAIKQFQTRQLKMNIDQQLQKAGDIDNQKATDINAIFINEHQGSAMHDDYKQQLYRKSSFGLMDTKMKDLETRLKKHGFQVDLEQIYGFKKQMLFSQKTLREQQLQYQKYLVKKQRKQKMKDYFNKIHKEKLREDLDFSNNFKERFEDVKYDPLDIEGNLEKIKQLNLEREATIMPSDKKQQIHFKKTQRNMRNFILGCFYQDFLNANQKLYEKISITDLKYNQKKTVINVFWNFEASQLQQNQEQIKKMQNKLAKSASYISGKMTQVLGLRYGPEIRFIYDKKLESTLQIKKSLQQVKQQVIDYEINNLKSKGHIKTHEDLAKTREKLQFIANQNIKDYHNRGKLLSKKYKQAEKNTKLTPNSKRKPAEVRFWEQIDKL